LPNQEKRENDEREQKSVSKDQDSAGSNAGEDGMTIGIQQAHDRLGLGLKNMYQNVLDEPLPDEMMALLDQLGDLDDENGSDSHADE
jgi:hypothetical protein